MSELTEISESPITISMFIDYLTCNCLIPINHSFRFYSLWQSTQYLLEQTKQRNEKTQIGFKHNIIILVNPRASHKQSNGGKSHRNEWPPAGNDDDSHYGLVIGWRSNWKNREMLTSSCQRGLASAICYSFHQMWNEWLSKPFDSRKIFYEYVFSLLVLCR